MCGHCSNPQEPSRVTLAVAEMRYIDILVNNDQIDKHDKPLAFAKVSSLITAILISQSVTYYKYIFNQMLCNGVEILGVVGEI